jgi:outer membrane protein TolC
MRALKLFVRVLCIGIGAGLANCTTLLQQDSFGPSHVTGDQTLLAPASASGTWSWQEAAAIPGGSATLNAFTARAPMPSPSIEPTREYDLAALIDLAQRANPNTRADWDVARAAAAKVGIAEGAYLPTLSAIGSASFARLPEFDRMGPFLVRTGVASPLMRLDWLLIDFGRREADVNVAAQAVLAADLQFTREQQSVTLAVQTAYFALEASRARIRARQVALKAAQAVEEAVGIRAKNELASSTDQLLAHQAVLQRQFDIAAARRDSEIAQAQLAEAIGISPLSLPKVASISTLPLPSRLPRSVDLLLQQALANRPDLAAKFAQISVREAELDRVRADYLPTLSTNGALGRAYRQLDVLGPDGNNYYAARTTWGIGLDLKWELFDGFIRDNRMREAKARRDQAVAEFNALELASQAQVWKAYADFKQSLSQYRLAKALVAATKSAYDGALTGYRNGITNVIELLAAERDFARALATEVDTRSAILASAAAIAYAAGTSR